MANATFTVNGSAVTGAVAVSASSTVTVALVDTTGARTIEWLFVGNHHSNAINPTITPAGDPLGATATFPMPAGPNQAYLLRCRLNGGVDVNGRTESSATFRAVIGVVNNNSVVPTCNGEVYERQQTHGTTEIFNFLLNLQGSGVTNLYASDINNDTNLDGANLQEVLNGLDASEINNDSGVAGDNVDDALDNLATDITNIETAITPGAGNAGYVVSANAAGDGFDYSEPESSISNTVGADGQRHIKRNDVIVATDYPYNARAGTGSTTVTCTASSTSVVLASAQDFEDRDGVILFRQGAAHSLISPAAPTCTVIGTAGTTTREYRTAVMTEDWGWTNSSAVTTVANAPDTLSQTNYVKVEPSAVEPVHGYVQTNQSTSAFTVAQSDRTYVANDRVLLLAQSTGSENGPWVVGTVGGGTAALTRPADFESASTAVSGTLIFTKGGSNNLCWQLVTAGNPTIDTDSLSFASGAYKILVYVSDSRTPAGAYRYLEDLCVSTNWDTAAQSPEYYLRDIGTTDRELENWMPTAAPTSTVRDALRTRIVSGGGTVNLVLADAPALSLVQYFRHDNTIPLREAVAAASSSSSSRGRSVYLPGAESDYELHGNVEIDKAIRFMGDGQESTVIRSTMHGFRLLPGEISATGNSSFLAKISDLKLSSYNGYIKAGNFITLPYTTARGYSAEENERLSMNHGAGALDIRTLAIIENVTVDGYGGNGVVVAGREDDDGSNANQAILRQVRVSGCSGNGFVVNGGDGNWVLLDSCTASNSGEIGIRDESFLGISVRNCLTQANRICGDTLNPTAFTEWTHFYSEGGQQPLRDNSVTCVFGGDHGSLTENFGLSIIHRNSVGGGIRVASGTSGTRSYLHLGNGNTSSGDFLRFQREDDDTSGQGIFTTWLTARERFTTYCSSSSYTTDEIDPGSTRIYGGRTFPRGLMGEDLAGLQSVVRWSSGTPSATAEANYDAGDLIKDSTSPAAWAPASKCGYGPARANSTVYVIGKTVRPATPNGYCFVATTNGTTASSEPAGMATATPGDTVTDGGVSWSCWGTDTVTFLPLLSGELGTDNVTNNSTVSGTTTTDALDNLATQTGTIVTDHGALTGLSDVADHPSYYVLDGSRALTGSVTVGTGGEYDLATTGARFAFAYLTNLDVSGDAQVGNGVGNATVDIQGSASGYSTVGFSDAVTNVGYVRYHHADDELHFGTSSATRWQIDTIGHLTPLASGSYDFCSDAAGLRSVYIASQSSMLAAPTSGARVSGYSGGLVARDTAGSIATVSPSSDRIGSNPILALEKHGVTTAAGTTTQYVTLEEILQFVTPSGGTKANRFHLELTISHESSALAQTSKNVGTLVVVWNQTAGQWQVSVATQSGGGPQLDILYASSGYADHAINQYNHATMPTLGLGLAGGASNTWYWHLLIRGMLFAT